MDASVSLATFSNSWEAARWTRSTWVTAPLGRLATSCQKARGAAGLSIAFLRALEPLLQRAPRQFVAELFASRYAPLYGAAAPQMLEDATGRELAACLRSVPAAKAPEAQPALRAGLRATGEAVARLLTDPDPHWPDRRYSSAIARELAGDYVGAASHPLR